MKELKKAIEDYKQNFNLNIDKSKKTNSLIRTLFRKENEVVALNILLNEAKDFVEFYFTNQKDLIKGFDFDNANNVN